MKTLESKAIPVFTYECMDRGFGLCNTPGIRTAATKGMRKKRPSGMEGRPESGTGFEASAPESRGRETGSLIYA
jgi:hypothetical protein